MMLPAAFIQTALDKVALLIQYVQRAVYLM